MSVFSNFFDPFATYLALICLPFVIADWTLGKQTRSALRYAVADWCLHVSSLPIAGLIVEVTSGVLGLLRVVFGNKLLSVRFVLTTLMLSLVGSLFLFAQAVALTSLSDWLSASTNGALETYLRLYYPFTILNFFLLLLSVVISIHLFLRMQKMTALLPLLFLMYLDYLIAVWLIAVAIWMNGITVFYSQGHIGDSGDLLFLLVHFFEPQIFTRTFHTFLNLHNHLLAPLFTSKGGWEFLPIVAPTILLVLLFAFRLLLKICSPVLMPVTNTLFRGFQQSRPGIVTLIVLGEGLVIKLAQQAFKVWGG